MNPDLIFSPLTAAGLLALGVFALALAFRPSRAARAVDARLDNLASNSAGSVQPQTSPVDVIREPFVQRVLAPTFRQLIHKLGAMMPPQTAERLNEQLVVAGRPGNLTGLDFLGIRVLAAAAGLLFGVFYLSKMTMIPQASLLGPIGGLLFGYMLPNNWLQGRMRQRQETITRALPDALDMLTICVEAGLAFESAMQRVGEQWKGGLSEELTRVVSEIRLGVPRGQALRRLAQRCDVPDVSSFVAVLVQADSMGTSIANVLRSQADQMRVLRRQRAEEKANKAPIKVIMAMLMFIFPALFIVILGPAVPKVIEAFGGMGR